MRKEDESVSYCRECTDCEVCAACAPNSPVTKFKRLRTIIFVPLFPDDPNTEYEVRCSCPFQPVVGAPCHHFCLFINVLPRHINIRYHKAMDVLYKRKGQEDKLDDYRRRLCHNKLIVTKEERDWILRQAHTNASPMSVFRSESSVPVQMNKNGIFVREGVSKMRAAQSAAAYLRDDTYNQGGLEEDLRSPPATTESWPQVAPPAPSLGALPQDLGGRLAGMMEMLVERHKDDPVATAELSEKVENLFCSLMAKMDSRGLRPVVTPTPTKKVEGTKRGAIGMKTRNFETAFVYNRRKSSCEPRRKPAKKSRKTKIDGQSLVS